MLPVIALVGRPNVGKSTLFNCITRTRDALVADQPGLTRDRQYGVGKIGPRPFLVLDTGGLSGEAVEVDDMIANQVWKAIDEANVIVFLVDGRAGLTGYDEEIAKKLRRSGKPIIVCVNKAEDRNTETFNSDFHRLGLGNPVAISAAHQQGIYELVMAALAHLPEEDAYLEEQENEDEEHPIRLAVIGRPNVGKSTLINRLLGEERVLACDMPGTTRDSIEIPFEKNGQKFILIDTAGIRRRSKIDDKIEKFSIIKSLQALERSNVVLFMFDAHTGVTDQDASLLGHVLDSGRALVIAINKWDHLAEDQRERIRVEFDRKFSYVNFAKILYISALHGTAVGSILEAAMDAYFSATRKFSTNELTELLKYATSQHQAPLVKGLAPKLRYAHQGGKNPPRIIIHGNRTDHIKDSYKRYLMNFFVSHLNISGTPIRLEFRSGDNPYKDNK